MEISLGLSVLVGGGRLNTTTIVGRGHGSQSGDVRTGLGANLSEDSGLFENPICRWSSCTSCCCERDNSFVPPPGAPSASGKADWPIFFWRQEKSGWWRG